MRFGGRDQWKEASRDEYRSRALDDLARDIRHALRTLRSAPSFTIAAVATLALGIGATTAIFSAVYGVLLEPLPVPDRDRVVAVYQNNHAKGIERDAVAPGNFAEWDQRSRAYTALGAAEPFGLTYSAPEGEEEIPNFNVTRGFFPALGVRPVLGRLFDDADYQPHHALSLVLSYGSWQRRFGGDPHIVGRTILISKAPATIIGVLPRDFSYLETLRGEMFAPKVFDSVEINLRSDAWYYAVGRLKPGVSMAGASADMNRVARQLAGEYPNTNRETGVSLVPLRDSIVGDSRTALLLLLGAVGFVLLIACTNVVNLLLAHTNKRAHEFAIRPEPTLYLPHAQAATGSFSVVARTAIDPAALTNELRRVVADINPEVPVASVKTLDDMVSDSLKPRRFVLALFGCFSVAALALALVGVYGVINHATLERSREFGVRIALGAGPSAVLGMVMAQGVGAALGGLAIGLAGAAALTGVVRGMLYGVAPIDAITFASVAIVMLGTAALACYLPARRATRIDPLDTLRAG